MVEVVLFDVFGTLVAYERDVATLAYPSTHRLLIEWGMPSGHDEFVACWSSASTALEEIALVEHREYGMIEIVAEFAARCSVTLTEQQQAQLVASFMAEWHLGVLDAFDVVLLSIDHGHRKPHPSIYAAAADAFECPPSRIAFVGDTVDADFDGPTRAGMHAWLVDPLRVSGVHPARRLDHILDIEDRLAR